MNIFNKSLIVLLVVSTAQLVMAQGAVSGEETVVYYMAAYNLHPNDNLYPGDAFHPSPHWVDKYIAENATESAQWTAAQHDEFKRNAVYSEISGRLQSKLASVNFEKQFTLTFKADLSEYDFDKGQFTFDWPRYRGNLNFDNLTNGAFSIQIAIMDLVNGADVPLVVKMDKVRAKQFIDSRKDANGYINREVMVKLVYRFTRLALDYSQITSLDGLQICADKLEVFEDKNMRSNIATFMPATKCMVK